MRSQPGSDRHIRSPRKLGAGAIYPNFAFFDIQLQLHNLRLSGGNSRRAPGRQRFAARLGRKPPIPLSRSPLIVLPRHPDNNMTIRKMLREKRPKDSCDRSCGRKKTEGQPCRVGSSLLHPDGSLGRVRCVVADRRVPICALSLPQADVTPWVPAAHPLPLAPLFLPPCHPPLPCFPTQRDSAPGPGSRVKRKEASSRPLSYVHRILLRSLSAALIMVY